MFELCIWVFGFAGFNDEYVWFHVEDAFHGIWVSQVIGFAGYGFHNRNGFHNNCWVSPFMCFTINMSFTIKYYKFKLFNDIKAVLMECRESKDFAKLCFKYLFRFDINVIFSSQLVYDLLIRDIVVKGVGQYEIWFKIS